MWAFQNSVAITTFACLLLQSMSQRVVNIVILPLKNWHNSVFCRMISGKPGTFMGEHRLRKRMHSATRNTVIKRVSVEGNIAVGKSTFARLLGKTFKQWEVVPEPISKWQNVTVSTNLENITSHATHGGNLLHLLYEDTVRWAFTFQTCSLLSRIKAHLEPPSEKLQKAEDPVQIFERSVYTDRYVFARAVSEMHFINEVEWAVYQDWHNFLMQQFGKRLCLDGVIYLQASPEICLERSQKRDRYEEKGLSVNYLAELHRQHENWLIHRSSDISFEHIRNIPVLVLDVSKEFEDIVEEEEKLLNQVKNFIKTL